MSGREDRALGPVQVLLIGIDEPGAERMLAAELQDLGTQDAVAVLDVLRVRRGPDDAIRRLDPVVAGEHLGRLIEALLVVGPEEGGGGEGEPPAGTWLLAERIPSGSAVAILLLEHRWAIPLREAAAGFEAAVRGDAWVHPRDLARARATLRPVGSGGT